MKKKFIIVLGLLQDKVALLVATEGEKWKTCNHSSTRFQLVRDSLHHFDRKNVFKDNAVNKSVRMGQSLMIIKTFSSKSIDLLYFEIRTSLLSTL